MKYSALKYCLRTAYEAGIEEHPQTAMTKLGIKYRKGIPESIGDCWFFMDCEFDGELPEYLEPSNYKD